MSALQQLIKEALADHQVEYTMLTAKDGPISVCGCGVQTDINLPKDRMTWKSEMIEALKIEAHTRHQSEMVMKKISE